MGSNPIVTSKVLQTMPDQIDQQEKKVILPQDLLTQQEDPSIQYDLNNPKAPLQKRIYHLVNDLIIVNNYAQLAICNTAPEELLAECQYSPSILLNGKRDNECKMNYHTSALIEDEIRQTKVELKEIVTLFMIGNLNQMAENECFIKIDPERLEYFKEELKRIQSQPFYQEGSRAVVLASRFCIFTDIYHEFENILQELAASHQGFFDPNILVENIQKLIEVSKKWQIINITVGTHSYPR